MKVNNPTYATISINWDNITLPLTVGTPMDLGGHISNNNKAIGIVPMTIREKPLINETTIIIGGDVCVKDVPNLSNEAMLNMKGIHFYNEDGSIVDNDDTDISALATRVTNVEGRVCNNITDLTEAPTASDFNGLLSALKTAGLMESE